MVEIVLTNLNAGLGEPCAGQVRLRLWSSECEYLIKSVTMENLGFDPPIGSTTSTYEIISLVEMGNPWYFFIMYSRQSSSSIKTEIFT